MKAAFVTSSDPSNVQAWSGTIFYMLQAIQNSGIKTFTVGNLRESDWNLSKFKKLFYLIVCKKNYLRNRELLICKKYASQIKKKLTSSEYDIIFSPGTLELAYLKPEKPVVIWADATFAGMVDFYPEFTNLASETIRNGHRLEQMTLSKCRLAIYSSEWAANSAISNYQIDPNKVKIVPFGANIDSCRDLSDIKKLNYSKRFDICKLLFVGVDWNRKGGDIVLDIAKRLNASGLRTELHVVGCAPPFETPSFVKKHGFISKKSEQGRQQIDQLFSESHFLVLPTRSECFGVVFPEASSFGLPCLATNVGGVRAAVRDGVNGWTFQLDSPPDTYCEKIKTLMSSPQDYKNFSLSCFQEYSKNINWNTSSIAVSSLIEKHCN
jgi:glycosyltransferase involved in cell wall biosynthesis